MFFNLKRLILEFWCKNRMEDDVAANVNIQKLR